MEKSRIAIIKINLGKSVMTFATPIEVIDTDQQIERAIEALYSLRPNSVNVFDEGSLKWVKCEKFSGMISIESMHFVS